MVDAEQVPSARESELEHERERGVDGAAASGAQRTPTQQERAEATLRSIMAGGNLTAETMKLSNEFTDRHMSRLKGLFRRSS
ncbi:hypothetical protein C5B85_08435 [Pseudoclavibacter sp. AY1F1]|uniref:hypothetical protein n=1 Tax=Pseudoclavibacter sp. AY1F1 TaxID=2080583 RepID=UPI000CE9018A|nr:hypothetical protein [Pseudoclavibacter sp. AY1F1]PPF44769.1 hypothetical protein C5B85_08435 [Pseudoclavibacter sp. AY1F1]